MSLSGAGDRGPSGAYVCSGHDMLTVETVLTTLCARLHAEHSDRV